MTPHEYVVPTNQNVRILEAKTTTHPYPPSGTWESASREAAIMVSGSAGSKLESSGCDSAGSGGPSRSIVERGMSVVDVVVVDMVGDNSVSASRNKV